MTGSRQTLLACVVVAGALLAPELAWAQCPMCRRALESAAAEPLAAAFRSGILFLLAAPFIVFGVVATLAVREGAGRGKTSVPLPAPLTSARPHGEQTIAIHASGPSTLGGES